MYATTNSFSLKLLLAMICNLRHKHETRIPSRGDRGQQVLTEQVCEQVAVMATGGGEEKESRDPTLGLGLHEALRKWFRKS